MENAAPAVTDMTGVYAAIVNRGLAGDHVGICFYEELKCRGCGNEDPQDTNLHNNLGAAGFLPLH